MATLTDVIDRPASQSGLWSWITTVDHKRIGVLYGVTAFIFLLLGGVEAGIIRLQLAVPDSTLVSADTFNQMFTMHGTTMIFLVIMPLSASFFNFVIPLAIGARDVAFPRLNAFSYWVFLFGGLLLNASFLTNQAPDAGWFSYANLTEKPFSANQGLDYWALGLQVLGVSSLAAAFNFIVTIVNMRAPGMSLMRMPLFVWMTLVTSILLVLAFPVITVGLIELTFDRNFGTNFFVPEGGGDPILWQHLFWVFGHPEVYILILPAMGIVSEVLPTFSRKPLFGYPVVVFSGVVIGIMGWAVWSHHMFTVGLGPVAVTVFMITTMLIAVPTGVKIFNWIGTLWGGQIDLKTAMLFALGFVALFIVGGLSGVSHAVAPSDNQQQDTYYIVAHIHYVLFGGALFRHLCRCVLLVPQVDRQAVPRGPGQTAFLALLHRNECYLLPDALPGPERYAPPDLHLRQRVWLGRVESAGLSRIPGTVRGHLDLRSQRVNQPAQGTRCGPRPVGRAGPGVEHCFAAPVLQFCQDPGSGGSGPLLDREAPGRSGRPRDHGTGSVRGPQHHPYA